MAPSYRGFGLSPRYWLIANAAILFLCFAHLTIIGSGLDWELPVGRMVLAGLGMLFAVSGTELSRLKPNGVALVPTVHSYLLHRELHNEDAGR